MSSVTHLTKRYDGIFYVEVRLTRFTNKSWLLRHSLSTRLHREARLRLCAYQSWLLLIQTPAEINENVAHIIQQVHKFVDERGQRSAFDVNHRKHFHSALSRMLDDWRVARPNPITYRTFWARLDELAHVAAALGQIVKDDQAASSSCCRDDYLLPPDDSYSYFTENGRVVHIQPYALDRRNADDFYRPDDMTKPPRFAVGDVITEVVRHSNQGQAVRVAAAPEPAQRPVAPAGAATDNARAESPATIAPVTSELLARCLIELAEESGSRTADNDVRPYVEFLIHILGDRPIASYDRDDFRQLSLAFSAVPLPSVKAGRSLIERYVLCPNPRVGRPQHELDTLRQKLGMNRLTTPLFNSGLYVSDFEAALICMAEVNVVGEQPQAFAARNGAFP